MSLTSEMNLMDLLFDKEDPSLNLAFDKDDLNLKNELVDIDTKPSFGISVSQSFDLDLPFYNSYVIENKL